MIHSEMLRTLIDCYENMKSAKEKYEKHPGGGASQKIKNQLAKELRIKNAELDNSVFNIKQLLK